MDQQLVPTRACRRCESRAQCELENTYARWGAGISRSLAFRRHPSRRSVDPIVVESPAKAALSIPLCTLDGFRIESCGVRKRFAANSKHARGAGPRAHAIGGHRHYRVADAARRASDARGQPVARASDARGRQASATPDAVAALPRPGTTTPGSIRFGPRGHVTYLVARDGATSTSRAGSSRPTPRGPARGSSSRAAARGRRASRSRRSARRERARQYNTGVASYAWAADADRMLVPLDGALYVLDGGGAARPLAVADAPAPGGAARAPRRQDLGGRARRRVRAGR